MPNTIFFYMLLMFIVPIGTIILVIFIMNWMNRYLKMKNNQNELLREAIKTFIERKSE